MSPRYRSLVRRIIAIVLMVALVVRSPLTPATPSAVHAATSCVPYTDQWSGEIVQGCALGGNFHSAVEQPIIDGLLQTFNLPPSDAGRLLSWQRNMVRAAVFADLMSIIKTPPDARTADEQAVVDNLTSLVQSRRVQAAEYAKQQYNKWAANPCGYTPPGPYAGTYDVTDYCNSIQVGFGPPPPPTLQNFEDYGAYLENSDMNTNSGLSGISQQAAYALGLLGGVAAGAAIGAAITFVPVAAAVSSAIFPFAADVVGGAFTGPLIVLALAITIIIIGSIEVAQITQLPDQLDQGVTKAQAPLDLAALVQSTAGLQEVYGAYIRTTMPGYGSISLDSADFPPDEPAPAYTAGDRKFGINPPTGPATQTGQLTYLDWAGHQQTAWLDGGWFVVEDSAHNLSLSLSIKVQGPSFNYSVERHGDDFFYVGQNGDTGLGLSPLGFTYKTWTGEVDEAHLAPPDGTPPWIDTAAVTSDGAGNTVPYDFGTTATEPVTVTFTCHDTDGASDIAVCPAPITYTGPISTTIRVWASDWSGNIENNVLGPVIIWPAGYNLPTITAGATTADGKPYSAGTWTYQSVTVHYTCDDPVSGILSCPNDQIFSTDGIAGTGGQVVANSGFVNQTTFGPINIDTTPPSIALASATTADGKQYVAGTWTNQTVTLHYTCSDNLSGIAGGSCQDQTFGEVPGGVTYATGTATDNAGNTATSAGFGPIEVDQTPPTVSCQSASFVYGQSNALVSATVSDATSGPQGGQPGGTTTISAAVSTGVVGPATVSLTGQDNAGNSKKVSCSYSVGQAQTSTSLTSSVSSSMQGQAVTFTAPVAVQSPGAGTPSGTVTFKDGSTVLSTGQLSVVNGTDQATFSTGSLGVGAHTITASYGGDANFTTSTSASATQYVDTNLSSFPTTTSGAYNLNNTNLAGAYLGDASLAGANLTNANLKGASLANANLSGADLSNGNFKGVIFSGANLTGANLTNANLTGATGLSPATLNGVTWSATQCPDGTSSDKDGGTCVGHL